MASTTKDNPCPPEPIALPLRPIARTAITPNKAASSNAARIWPKSRSKRPANSKTSSSNTVPGLPTHEPSRPLEASHRGAVPLVASLSLHVQLHDRAVLRGHGTHAESRRLVYGRAKTHVVQRQRQRVFKGCDRRILSPHPWHQERAERLSRRRRGNRPVF